MSKRGGHRDGCGCVSVAWSIYVTGLLLICIIGQVIVALMPWLVVLAGMGIVAAVGLCVVGRSKVPQPLSPWWSGLLLLLAVATLVGANYAGMPEWRQSGLGADSSWWETQPSTLCVACMVLASLLTVAAFIATKLMSEESPVVFVWFATACVASFVVACFGYAVRPLHWLW